MNRREGFSPIDNDEQQLLYQQLLQGGYPYPLPPVYSPQQHSTNQLLAHLHRVKPSDAYLGATVGTPEARNRFLRGIESIFTSGIRITVWVMMAVGGALLAIFLAVLIMGGIVGVGIGYLRSSTPAPVPGTNVLTWPPDKPPKPIPAPINIPHPAQRPPKKQIEKWAGPPMRQWQAYEVRERTPPRKKAGRLKRGFSMLGRIAKYPIKPFLSAD
jgi:hypothetical protein